MYLFKTSGKTFDSVIKNERHAFSSIPQNWHTNEIVLVSKNKNDCNQKEKQIQYTMQLDNIRIAKSGEIGKYWPGYEGHWKYIFMCKNTKIINQPFNLEELLGEESKPYRTVQTFRKLAPKHEKIIEDYLRNRGAL